MESDCAPIPFTDFPEDVQLCILSFLSLPEIAVFACTSKHSLSLSGSNSKLWHAMCDRRWGSMTQIEKWGSGRISYKLLYRTLSEWENLIGFWRRSAQTRPPSAFAGSSPPPLVLFEWGPSFVTGSRISPSQNGTYDVIKSPFLWMCLSSHGENLNFIDPDGKRRDSWIGELDEEDSISDDVISVDVSFVGGSHMVVEEKMMAPGSNLLRKKELQRSSSPTNLIVDEEEVNGGADSMSPGSLPDDHMSEMYQYFANRTSPGRINGLSRRQRRKEKLKQGKMKWGAEHFVKIANCSPTPSRPLQGLWKGIGEDMQLEFYLVSYEETGGGIACRRFQESAQGISRCPFVFWTSKANTVNSPFSAAELLLYENRLHLHPPMSGGSAGNEDQFYCQVPPPLPSSLVGHESENGVVDQILCINSSEGLLLHPPDTAVSINPCRVEGRIWQYENGTFGFGFLRDNFIVDMKHIIISSHNGGGFQLIDAVRS